MKKNSFTNAIVFGADHYNTLWSVRTLGMAGIKVTLIILADNIQKSFVAKSKYVTFFYQLYNNQEVIELLKSLDYNTGKIPLYSTGDKYASLIDKHYSELSNKYFLFNCGDKQGGIVHWMNKKAMTEEAKKCGFLVPWTKHVSLNDNETYQDLKYPCIIKPLISAEASKLNFRICNDEAEVQKAILDIKENCTDILVQEFIKPDYELSIIGMRHRKTNTILIPGLIHKLATCTSYYNLGMTTKAYLDSEEMNQYLDKKVISSFLRNIDYDGLFSIEFFVKGSNVYFLEINMRHDGNLFLYTSSGVNLPYIWGMMSLGEKIEDKDMMMKRKRTYGIIEISFIKYSNWFQPITILKDWWKTDCYSIFSWKDIKPFFYKFIYAL